MKKLFKGDRRGPKMLGIVVPVIADPVLGPTVTYDEVASQVKCLPRWIGSVQER